MTWIQHLFSARVARASGGSVDGFHVLTNESPGDYQFTENILRRPRSTQRQSVAFIQDCGDRLYIGLDGHVDDVLGKGSPYAFEKTISRHGPVIGRPITFVHGYFGKKGEVSIPDIRQLRDAQRGHLEDVLRRANGPNGGEDPVKTEAVSFSKPVTPLTKWDIFAREFEEGRHKGKIATFTHDGELLEWIGTKAGKVAENGKSSAAGGKKTLFFEMPRRIAFLPLAAITLGLLATGWMAWEMWRRAAQHQSQQQRGTPEP